MLNMSKIIKNLLIGLACFGYVVSCTKVPTYFEKGSSSDTLQEISYKATESIVEYINDQEGEFDFFIDSFGGSVLLGDRIAVALQKAQARGAKSTCYVVNQAYSMGFTILQSCTNRVLTYGATMMQHMPHTGNGFENMDFSAMTQEQIKSYQFAMALSLRHALKRMDIGIEEYFRRYLFSKWYIQPTKMCEDNIIDSYITVDGLKEQCHK